MGCRCIPTSEMETGHYFLSDEKNTIATFYLEFSTEANKITLTDAAYPLTVEVLYDSTTHYFVGAQAGREYTLLLLGNACAVLWVRSETTRKYEGKLVRLRL